MNARKECACPLARHTHGTPAAHRRCGCRCLLCRVAYAAQATELRNGRRGRETSRTPASIPNVGTARRIQALHAIGWSLRLLAEHSGIDRQQLHKLHATSRPVMPATAAKVAAMYDALWNQPPPRNTQGERQAAAYALTVAKKHGWPVPMAWSDDEIDDPTATPWEASVHREERARAIPDPIAVAEAVRGRHVDLTVAERAEAVRQLSAMGLNVPAIAARIGTTTRTVQRRRAA